MTFDEFAPPFALLQTHFEQRPRGEQEQELYTLSWYRIMEPISAAAWSAAVERWCATQKWMPKPVEMRETCYEEATRLVHEREEAEREERRAQNRLARAQRPSLPGPDRAEVEAVREALRRLREAKQIPGPAAPRMTDDDR